MKLYELSDAIERIYQDCVDRETGELREDFDALLDSLEMDRDKLALQIGRILVGEEIEAEAVKMQADRLAERARIHRNHAERLKAYLRENLPEGHKLRDDCVRISWRKSRAVVITDESKLPDDVCKVVRTPSKTMIKAAIEDGEALEGAYIEELQNLQVK